MQIHGFVDRSFEPVREAFATGAGDLRTGGGAFAAFLDGAPVVDLWAGHAKPGVAWDEHTPAIYMSCTKGIAAIAVAMLAERGRIDVDAPISKYWPEFADERILVRHVLTHSSGLPVIPNYRDFTDLEANGWDEWDRIASSLAVEPPRWEPGTKIGYHVMTFTWLVGELVRRAEGRSIAEIVRDEIAPDIEIGMPIAEQHRIAAVKRPPLPTDPTMLALYQAGFDPDSLLGQALLSDGTDNCLTAVERTMANERVMATELSSSNGCGTARALAGAYAAMPRLLEWDTIVRFGSTALETTDAYFGLPARYALGFMRPAPPLPGALPTMPEPESFGHPGYGGQLAFFDPVRRLAVGFVRNDLSAEPGVLGPALVDVLYRCLEQ